MGMTKDEFKHLFTKIRAKVERMLRDDPDLLPGPLRYAIDQGTFHNFTAAELGLKQGQLIKAPAMASELMKVVEHQQRGVKARAKRKINDDPTLTAGPRAIKAVKTAAQMIKKEKVGRDAASLLPTYQDVITRKGDYASPPNR